MENHTKMQTMFTLDSARAYDHLVTPTLTGDAETLARARIDRLAPILQAKLRDAAVYQGRALDSIPSDRGYFLAQQLEVINGEAAKEVKRAALTALELFPIDSSIPAGAVTYKQRRKAGSAKMVYHSAANGSNPPTAAVEQWEEEYRIHTAVTGIRYNIFDLMHADFAGLGLKADLMRAMTRGTDEFLNDKAWRGDAENSVPGVLTHSMASRYFESINWDTATGEQVLGSLQAQYNLMVERHKGTGLLPDRCAIAVRKLNRLKDKLSSYHAQTIMEAFLQANRELSEDFFIGTHELDGAGPSGQDIMFWYSRKKESVCHVLPRGLTLLPAQVDVFDIFIPGYIRHGGIRMDEPLHNMLVYLPR